MPGDLALATGSGRAGMVETELRRLVGAASASTRLPSIRGLARRLGVAPATVVVAYERLVAEGIVVSRPASGFWPSQSPRPLALADSRPKPDRDVDPLWIMRQSLDMPAGMRPGCGWLPDAWLPEDLIRSALRAEARDPHANLTAYASPLGHAPLRQALARRLIGAGIEATPNAILITDSGSTALDLVCRLFLQPGDTVLIDDPGYFNLQTMIRAQRATAIGVPVTPEGPDLAQLEALARQHRPKLYLTTASLQNPTGAALSPRVAHRLLRLAEQLDFIVVEDDIFADFDTSGGPRLAALDGFERVIHLGSFSKTVSAAVRCGYVAARADWIEALTDLKLATSFGHQDLAARVIARLLVAPEWRRHLEATRTRLAAARAVVLPALRRLGLTPWIEPHAGLFVWASLPEGRSATELARRALAADIVLAPGNVFSVGGRCEAFLRFNVAQCDDPRLFPRLERLLAGLQV